MKSESHSMLVAVTFLSFVVFSNGLAYNRIKHMDSTGQSIMKDSVSATATCTSPVALGMEDGLIPDSAITASSWFKYNGEIYGPGLARLNQSPLGPWVKHDDDQAPWIQVDLGQFDDITGLQTQGGEGQDKAVTAFKVQAGLHPCGMDYIRSGDGTPVVFTSSGHSIVTHTFPQPIIAQYIRIEPTDWNEYCALRFEILGCEDSTRRNNLGIDVGAEKDNTELTPQDVCASPIKLGVESGELPGYLITASTIFKNDPTKYGIRYSRLNTPSKRWLPHFTDLTPWIQVDLYGRGGVVNGVITQGAPTKSEWVTSFLVSGGIEQCNMNYVVGSDSAPLVFPGNSDSNTEVTHLFSNPISWRFVRIEPLSWKTWPSLRFDVIGCMEPFTASCEADWISNGHYCYYFAHTSKGTYSEADIDCQSKDAVLASIQSLDEHNFITSYTQDDGSHNDFGYWIGLDDIVKEGTFEWLDGTPTNYVKWQTNQPNNYGGQDCTALWARKSWNWGDFKCSSNYHAHVCKKLG